MKEMGKKEKKMNPSGEDLQSPDTLCKRKINTRKKIIMYSAHDWSYYIEPKKKKSPDDRIAEVDPGVAGWRKRKKCNLAYEIYIFIKFFIYSRVRTAVALFS